MRSRTLHTADDPVYLSVQWALEEVGLPYRFHALDQTAGDLDSESFARLSPFHQIPVIDDDGFVLAETIEIFDDKKTATHVLGATRQLAGRWFDHLERRLANREWIALAEFTVADIAMASVLRTIRQTDLMAPYPNIKAYFERCHARPAWQRTLELAAERLHRSVEQLR